MLIEGPIYESEEFTPRLIYWAYGKGTVVYVNSDMLYSIDPIDLNTLQLVENAVRYASCKYDKLIPSVSSLGVALLVLIIFISSFYLIRKKRKLNV